MKVFGREQLPHRVGNGEIDADAKIADAFNTVPSEVLFDVFKGRGNAVRPSLVYCGDNETGKRVAATLIRDAGFDPVDGGPLRIARYTEPLALLVGQLAYRFERFGR